MDKEKKLRRDEEKKNKVDVPLDSRYVTKDDFDIAVHGLMDAIKGRKPEQIIVEKTVQEIAGTADLSKIKESSKSTPVPTDEEIAGGSEKAPIPPAWRKLVDEVLGLDFGLNVSYPQSGGGFLFKIIVPAEKSNMSKDYKEFYKVDVRTKSINYNEGVEGVRKFCELVKKNLEKKSTN